MKQLVFLIGLIAALIPNSSFARTTKKSAVEVSVSEFLNSKGEQGLLVDTRIPSNDWSEITAVERGGSVVQVRFYQQDEGAVKKEILNKESILLAGPVDEVVLDPEVVCATMGSKTLSVWISVRLNRATFPRNDAYENLESHFSYQCLGKDERQNIEMVTAPKFGVVNPNGGNLEAVNYGLGLDFNSEQYRNIKKAMRSLQMKLLVYRDIDDPRTHKVKTVRVPIGRPYLPLSSKPADYQVPIKGLCDEAAIYWTDIYEKKVQVSCEISVTHDTDSGRDFKFNSYSCPKWDVICPAK